MERSFGYSQAASSGIFAIVEECSDEDFQYIVDLHAESFVDT